MPYSPSIFCQQTGLKSLGFDPGPIDGFDGPRTRAALEEFSRSGVESSGNSTARPKPNTADKSRVFGEPGRPPMTTFTPPYPMEFSWGGRVTKIGCHSLIKDPLEKALSEIADKGKDWIKEHGLDIYAGCFSHRTARGGTALSDHAWAIAIDLNPDANGLNETWKPGQKGKNGTYQMPKEAVEIFRKHGFQVGFKTKTGRRDMMHIAFVDRS